MKKQHRFSIWYVIIGMWVVLFLHNMIAGSLTVKNIPYSEFVKAVKQGKVSEIAISENEIANFAGDGESSTEGAHAPMVARIVPKRRKRVITLS